MTAIYEYSKREDFVNKSKPITVHYSDREAFQRMLDYPYHIFVRVDIKFGSEVTLEMVEK